MKRNNQYITLILKHLEGELSSNKERELQEWIREGNDNKVLFEQMKQNWENEIPEEPVFDARKAFEQVLGRLDLSKDDPEISKGRSPLSCSSWLQLAAAFIGILIVSYFVYAEYAGSSIIYATEQGETATIILPDQSVITLYGNSTITYNKNWQDKKFRTVYLQGEAFFDVAKRKKPFIVRADDIRVRVLGTSFNVKSYAEDEFIETTLVEGKIKIRNLQNKKNKLVLSPNQKAIFSKKTKGLKLSVAKTEQLSALKNESFVFNNKRVGEVLKIISKKFAVKIKTRNMRIYDCTVTGDFSGQSLSSTLDLLCILINADYSIEKNEVSLKGAGCEI